ncbi:MAG: zf-TFIIB domain-containing protein [Limisphaerales bacterium]
MNCPACAQPLTKLQVEDVDLDACHGGCGGLWFDNFELAKFNEPHESSSWEQLLVSVDPLVEVNYQAKRACPKCSVPMLRHFCTAERRTQVDACPQCGGNWLDTGELAQLRAEFQQKAARAAAKSNPALNKHLRWSVVGD